ncbi:MAG: putative transcriptional regulator [Patiriisocius sp.]|jgi:predicted transcriptional regulator
MSYIDNLDKALGYVSLFSKNLTSIPTTDLEMNTGIDIDELTEYLEELGNRGFVNNYDNVSCITLQGRLAIKNAKNGKLFKEEFENKKLKKILVNY